MFSVLMTNGLVSLLDSFGNSSSCFKGFRVIVKSLGKNCRTVLRHGHESSWGSWLQSLGGSFSPITYFPSPLLCTSHCMIFFQSRFLIFGKELSSLVLPKADTFKQTHFKSLRICNLNQESLICLKPGQSIFSSKFLLWVIFHLSLLCYLN